MNLKASTLLNSSVIFENTCALFCGGAVFVHDKDSRLTRNCFVHRREQA